MGAVNSCCIPRRTFEECRENRICTPKGKGHRRNLSATFSFPTEDSDSVPNVVNINTATQEELMTLPGINRSTAQNIIEHRRQIGSFKKIEDVALVSGVGAAKLNNIRSEIVVSRRNESKSGSPDGSLNIDINNIRDHVPAATPVVNINTSNVFQLMKIKGVGQNLAENIVTYRDKKGPFQSIEDLQKVKGVGPAVLSAIKQFLTLDDSSTAKTPAHRHLNGSVPHEPLAAGDSTMSRISQMSRLSIENLLEMFAPLAKKGQRPDVVPFDFKNKTRRVFRIATWNLQLLSSEKSGHVGVQDAVCMTILENGFGILAVQEIADEKALENICDQLNHPKLPNVRCWRGRRGKWKNVVSPALGRMYKGSEYHGFLYDTSQNIKLVRSSVLNMDTSDSKLFTRKPFFSVFQINGTFDCVIISVHLKAAGLNEEGVEQTKSEPGRIQRLVRAVEDHFPGEHDILILGDFNMSPASEEFQHLLSKGYIHCIPSSSYTNISERNPDGNKSYDNIWLNKQAQKVYTGHSGVVRKGLTSPSIPNGWSWGGLVSDHCPVYAELYSSQDLGNGNISLSADGVHFTVGDS